MKFLIVGLGNPGAEYENTRHNIGFKVLDFLNEKHGGSFSLNRAAHTSTVKFKGKSLILVKPTTFMNLSGKAVHYWMQKEGVSLDHVLVVTDDLSLPFGKLRMKASGSDGGHNGLKDIQSTLATTAYTRLRFGIGNEFKAGRQVDYVLATWEELEQEQLPERIDTATQFIESFCTIGLQLAMTQWNGK